MCPATSKNANIKIKKDHLVTLANTVLENNRLTNKSQTVIPLGAPGAGKTWTCQVMLRRLMKNCGYDENTDMVKHIEAAMDVLKPLVTSNVGDNRESSRMVSINGKLYALFIITFVRLC